MFACYETVHSGTNMVIFLGSIVKCACCFVFIKGMFLKYQDIKKKSEYVRSSKHSILCPLVTYLEMKSEFEIQLDVRLHYSN